VFESLYSDQLSPVSQEAGLFLSPWTGQCGWLAERLGHTSLDHQLQNGPDMRFIPILTFAAACLIALPASAGPAEDAFLAKLTGSWTGSGTATGADAGQINCTMTFKPADGGEHFSGRCNAESVGFEQSFSGSMSYNDAKKQYEAESNGRKQIGTKGGGGVSFVTKISGMMGKGTSTMKVTASKITIDVALSGEKNIKSRIVFTK
jgi:hypothetical protein